MIISLFDNFGAKNSFHVFAAFKEGLNNVGIQWNTHDMTADVAVIWSVVWAGRMAQNKAVWDHFRAQGKPVIVLEVGMLQRGQTWKMAVNGTGSNAFHGIGFDSNRPDKLGLTVHPWKNNGSDILISVQRHDSQQWATQPPMDIWLEHIVSQLRQLTERPIVIRSHPRQSCKIPWGCVTDKPIPIPGTYDDFNFMNSASRAWAVINFNSGPGAQAIMSGIPAFVDSTSLAAPVGNLDITDIENPRRPDRSEWIIKLAHTEWTINEISTGYPLSRLLPDLS